MTTFKDFILNKEMEKHFYNRTNKHIQGVKDNAKILVSKLPEFAKLLEIVEEHDSSKFKEPELTPYIHIAWMYKMKNDGIEYTIPEYIDEVAATEHHVTHNKHHPEYWSGETTGLINKENRDLKAKLIDGTKMPDIYIAEMVCDWCSVANERGTNPHEWADMNINVRWKFTADQSDLIYKLIELVWGSNES